METFVQKLGNKLKTKWRVRGRHPKFAFQKARGQGAIPILVGGVQRSGTNMLMDCFDHYDCIDVQHDISRLSYQQYRLRPDAELDHLLMQSPGEYVVWKPLLDTVRIVPILQRHPEGYCCWIFRHYADVIKSMKHSFSGSREAIDDILAGQCDSWRGEHVTAEILERLRELQRPDLSQDEALALTWLARNLYFLNVMMPQLKNIVVISYENITATPHEVFGKISERIGLKPHDAAASGVFKNPSKQVVLDISPEIRSACDDVYAELLALCL